MIDHVFLRHPHSAGESYAEHARVAGSFGVALMGAGLACLVHAVIPVLFTRTTSDTVEWLHARLSGRRRRQRSPWRGSSPTRSERDRS